MKITIPCRFEFQHTPTWCGELYIGGDPKPFIATCVAECGGSKGGFEKFQAEIIQEAQELALAYARGGQIIAPTNHVAEFWNAGFVHKLSDALRRPKKRPTFPNLELLLKAGWESQGFCEMTAKELAGYLNKVFHTRYFKERTIWQKAYRMGLYSKRKNGPKPKAK